GSSPILISMPHNGSLIPFNLSSTMHDYALQSRDSDWFLDKLYDFTRSENISLIVPKLSRYAIDLNRSPDDKPLYSGADNTELCPTTQFDRKPLYLADKSPSDEQITARIQQYWLPYHQALQQQLQRLKQLHPVVILFDAHSIASRVPRFFEGQLPDFNFGTNDGKSCSSELLDKIKREFLLEGYSSVYNDRFKGGYITRHYGDPAQGIHSIQLELSQATYMNENDLSWNVAKANKVIPHLKQLIKIINDWIKSQ
ncbi:MAG TPA: N-formylglutamate deformylase, partial [Aeromonadales bacterium]|nr:N-formylglutamate deformylase [Aeromonadales bacterium]